MTLIRKHESSLPSIWNDLFERSLFSHPLNGHSEFTVPPVNISENDTSFLVELAAPGLKKEDFNINLDRDQMTISVEQSTKTEEETENKDEHVKYSKREFSYRSFRRSFTLPDTANLEGISAMYEDGVLKVNIAKKDEAKLNTQRKISVQ
ncbi:Hsp20/alpha crystallin family protein [Parvicella tangerina]|uniref:Small heat shock protein IbpB n=1 Tax=Parvicella tangerina TaxID=2829795 RepID=A0A916JL90_9FLAO|nr:Hsp20/alpha crystallin family protein [Parvicella tangerina]CAG5077270.1 Small heat shock protein IbpB [Parvicella tangerina]